MTVAGHLVAMAVCQFILMTPIAMMYVIMLPVAGTVYFQIIWPYFAGNDCGGPLCSTYCRTSQINNSQCDDDCFNAACNWDGSYFRCF